MCKNLKNLQCTASFDFLSVSVNGSTSAFEADSSGSSPLLTVVGNKQSVVSETLLIIINDNTNR